MKQLSEEKKRSGILRLQKCLNVEVICGEDDFEKHFLVDGDKFLVPLANVGGALARLIHTRLIDRRERVIAMVLAPFEDLEGTSKG